MLLVLASVFLTLQVDRPRSQLYGVSTYITLGPANTAAPSRKGKKVVQGYTEHLPCLSSSLLLLAGCKDQPSTYPVSSFASGRPRLSRASCRYVEMKGQLPWRKGKSAINASTSTGKKKYAQKDPGCSVFKILWNMRLYKT